MKLKKLGADIYDAFDYIFRLITMLTNEQSGGIGFINIDEDLSMFCEEIEEKRLIKIVRRFFKDLNLPLRNGYEKAYVSFNLGLSQSDAGRKACKAFLKAFLKGDLETKEPFIFPNIIFKVKKGINKEEGDRNYDLFIEALEVTSQRMNPTYFNCDSFELRGLDEEKIGIMGCRTLLGRNLYGIDGAVKRGNIATVSINLPRIARKSKNEEEFFYLLEEVCSKAKKLLLKRYNLLLENRVENFNYILKNDLFCGAKEALKFKDLKECFKHGTLSIGFIGLFDAIGYLKKEKIDLEMIENSLDLAEKIMKKMRSLTDIYSKENRLNFSLIATAGESLCYKFAKDDLTKEYYTNSFHVPVYISISPFRKMEIESMFSKYCNGGSISYVEFETPILNNISAVEDIVKFGINLGEQYIGINFPLDYCKNCHTTSVFKGESCSVCGSKELVKLRRVSGYLSLKETLKNGKKQEEADRIAHFKGEDKNEKK